MSASLSPAQHVDPDDDASTLPMFWLSLFAAILIVGLLFAFQQVVHAAVDQAASKRISANADARSSWLCKAAPTQAERQGCLAKSSVPQKGNVGTPSITHAAFEATAARP